VTTFQYITIAQDKATGVQQRLFWRVVL